MRAKQFLGMLDRGETLPTSVRYPIATWTFADDLAMVFLSHEVVVDYALRLKRELDGDRLWINAYSNDVSSYIVSKRLLNEGGYEVNNSLSTSVTYGHPERVHGRARHLEHPPGPPGVPLVRNQSRLGPLRRVPIRFFLTARRSG